MQSFIILISALPVILALSVRQAQDWEFVQDLSQIYTTDLSYSDYETSDLPLDTNEKGIEKLSGLQGIKPGVGRNKLSIGGITPPPWLRDLIPPECKKKASDGSAKNPTCCSKKVPKRSKYFDDPSVQRGCAKCKFSRIWNYRGCHFAENRICMLKFC